MVDAFSRPRFSGFAFVLVVRTKGHAQRYTSLASRMLVLSSFHEPQSNKSSLNAKMQAATTLSDHHLEDVEAHRKAIQMIAPFSLAKFLAANGKELRDYVEPYLIDGENLSKEVLKQLLDLVRTLDTEHTLYALELCAMSDIERFPHTLVRYFSNSDASVCSTAFRLFMAVPLKAIDDELIIAVCSVPIVRLFANDVVTKHRIGVGTNEQFLREVRDYLDLP